MSDADFTIRLAPGLYMDSMGRFVSGPLDQVPTHPAPGGGLPIDPDAVKKALSGISDALPKTGDPKSEQALLDLGVPSEVIQALGKIGEVAGTLAKVVPVVGVAVTIAKMVGLLKSGDDAVIAAIEKLWARTNALIQAKDAKWTTDEVFKRREAALRGLNAVTEFQTQVEQGLLTDPDDMRTRLSEMRLIHQGVAEAATFLMSPTLWQSSLNGPEFKWVWAPNLFFDPGPGDPGQNMRAFRPPAEQERFDHRVMAPGVCAVLQAYLTYLKRIVPEYRSSGEFSEFIGDMTLLAEDLAEMMVNQTVARTHWFPQEFAYVYPVKSPVSPLSAVLVPNLSGYHVGALDLRSTRPMPTDPPVPPYGFGWIYDMTGAQVRWGAMQFNWHPPVQLELEDFGTDKRFRVLNPDECAKAANARSEELFAAVLYSSGYFNLVHVTGLLRHVYTAPSESETVSGIVTPHRSPLPRSQVTVTGAPVFPYPPATSQAEREPQTTFVRANVNTQPRDRLIKFDYRVWLRTLPAKLDGTSEYSSVFRTRYEDEPQPRRAGTAPFKRLVCDFNDAGVLGQKKLAEGKTPAQLMTVEPMDVTLKADTFDWWIPVPEAVQSLPQLSEYTRELREQGWLQPRENGGDGAPAPTPTPAPGKFADAALVQGAVYEPTTGIGMGELVRAPSLAPIGERRMIEREDVTVRCSLTWNGIDLTVRVEGDPKDRNYDLYLVLEERLGDHQVWLHTPFLLPVTGQLTFVPEKFFKDEQDLIDKSNEFWNDFNDHYTESQELSPLDPIVQVNTWRDRSTVEGLQRIAEVVRSEQPEVLEEFMRSRGVEVHEGERVEMRG
jgi:hypothetical protein